MQKLAVLIDQNKMIRRNTSFCQSSKKIICGGIEQLPQLPIQYVKTVKIINKKICKIPFLKLEDLRHIQRPKVLSLNKKEMEKLPTERRSTKGSTEEVSFFLHQCNLLITKKNPNFLKQNGLQKTKKASLLPPLTQHDRTSPVKFGKNNEMRQSSIENKKKAPRKKVQCKVLLAKHYDFPFYNGNISQLRKSERIKTKQCSNLKNMDFFELDVSQILQANELESEQFITQKSFKQFTIF